MDAYEAVAKSHGFSRLSKFSLTFLKGQRAFVKSYNTFLSLLDSNSKLMVYTDDPPTVHFICHNPSVDSRKVMEAVEVAHKVRHGFTIPPLRVFVHSMSDGSFQAYPLYTTDPNAPQCLDAALKTRGRHDTSCAICFEHGSGRLELVLCGRCSASVCMNCRVKIKTCPQCRRVYGTPLA